MTTKVKSHCPCPQSSWFLCTVKKHGVNDTLIWRQKATVKRLARLTWDAPWICRQDLTIGLIGSTGRGGNSARLTAPKQNVITVGRGDLRFPGYPLEASFHVWQVQGTGLQLLSRPGRSRAFDLSCTICTDFVLFVLFCFISPILAACMN